MQRITRHCAALPEPLRATSIDKGKFKFFSDPLGIAMLKNGSAITSPYWQK